MARKSAIFTIITALELIILTAYIPGKTNQANAQGIADQYPGDVGIENDPRVIFHDDFENGFGNWSYITPLANIVTDPNLVHRGNASAIVTATRGINSGGNLELDLNPEREQLYTRYCMKIDNDAAWPHHMGGIRAVKPPYSPNAGTRPGGNQAFWSSLEPEDYYGDGVRYWHLYSYWHEMRSWFNPDGSPGQACVDNNTCYYGNNFFPVQTEEIQRNRWYCIEAMLKANTPGSYDGEQAFWVDGVLLGRYRTGEPKEGNWLRDSFFTWGPYYHPYGSFEGYNWRTDSTVKINHTQLQWYHSDYKGSQVLEHKVYYDDVVVATDYIGPVNTTGEPIYPTPTETPSAATAGYNDAEVNVSGGCNLTNSATETTSGIFFILSLILIVRLKRKREASPRGRDVK